MTSNRTCILLWKSFLFTVGSHSCSWEPFCPPGTQCKAFLAFSKFCNGRGGGKRSLDLQLGCLGIQDPLSWIANECKLTVGLPDNSKVSQFVPVISAPCLTRLFDVFYIILVVRQNSNPYRQGGISWMRWRRSQGGSAVVEVDERFPSRHYSARGEGEVARCQWRIQGSPEPKGQRPLTRTKLIFLK